MNTTIINVKIDISTKKQAQQVAQELGLSLSSLIKAFLKRLIKTKHITFDVGEKPNKYLLAAMKQAEKNLKKGNHSPVFKTGEEAVAWLEKQGI